MNREKPLDSGWSSRFISPSSDNGGRRSGIDRRCFSYSIHIPERRSGIDRRFNKDRRKRIERRRGYRIERI
jgi:hypothetical protein